MRNEHDELQLVVTISETTVRPKLEPFDKIATAQLEDTLFARDDRDRCSRPDMQLRHRCEALISSLGHAPISLLITCVVAGSLLAVDLSFQARLVRNEDAQPCKLWAERDQKRPVAGSLLLGIFGFTLGYQVLVMLQLLAILLDKVVKACEFIAAAQQRSAPPLDRSDLAGQDKCVRLHHRVNCKSPFSDAAVHTSLLMFLAVSITYAFLVLFSSHLEMCSQYHSFVRHFGWVILGSCLLGVVALLIISVPLVLIVYRVVTCLFYSRAAYTEAIASNYSSV